MFRAILPLALCVASLGSSGALAAEQKPVQGTPKDALKIMHDYATCVAKREPKRVNAILLMDYRTPEYKKEMEALISLRQGCLGFGKLRMGGLLLPGALAEAKFEADFGARSSGDLFPADWSRNPVQALSDSDAMAYCVVRTAPDAARKVISTNVASGEEAEAIKEVTPVLPGCLAPGGSAKMNKPALRSLLALALYRSAKHFEPNTGVARVGGE